MRRHHKGLSAGNAAAAAAAAAGGKVNGGDPHALIREYDSDANPTRPVRPSPLTASTIQGLPLDLFDRLRSFPLFLSAPDSFLAAIGTHLRPQIYAPHHYILTEGDDAKAMYWLVRGAVTVTSRDGESTYAELRPGAFFGEIGILMDIPRTATIVAKLRSLVVRLNKEDLMKELPRYPTVERAILDEAKERLSILERKKREIAAAGGPLAKLASRSAKRSRDRMVGDVEMADAAAVAVTYLTKRRKSPSPGLAEAAASSALGTGSVNVRSILKELPLFASLPADILHFLGLNAQPCTYPPFTDIIRQGSQGRDVFFIIRGEVEVVKEEEEEEEAEEGEANDGKEANDEEEAEHDEDESLAPEERPAGARTPSRRPTGRVKARLKAGQYFGEMTSLSLAPRRTATVRTVTAVECLMIADDVLQELWQKCSPDLRSQVEETARKRLGSVADRRRKGRGRADGTGPVDGSLTIGGLTIVDVEGQVTIQPVGSDPALSGHDISGSGSGSRFGPSLASHKLPDDRPALIEPSDPDPFLNVDLDNLRSRSRRGSLAPPSPGGTQSATMTATAAAAAAGVGGLGFGSPFSPFSFHLQPFNHESLLKEADSRLSSQRKASVSQGPGERLVIPDSIFVHIFRHCDVGQLMRLRLVSSHWMKLLTTAAELAQVLDLRPYNRRVTDAVLANVISPFVGQRPRHVDLSNCFHLTDEGFAVLAAACARNVRSWKMKSVWDVTGQAVLEMINQAKALEEVDLSNCRKVGDNLLARVIGWVVPDLPPHLQQQQQQQQHQQHQQANRNRQSQKQQSQAHGQSHAQNHNDKQQQQQQQPVPGTVVGCPRLRRLTLSYCKHITDRSMAHLAVHAAARLEEIDLTRCTTITDLGFHHWSVYPFQRLRKLCLADCTYLTDNAIVYLTNAAKALRELDLSFCCALSDTATEVLALGCPSLTHLNLAFCGSAVSDSSMRSLGLHLLELQELSVRGCVRVTGAGVEAVVDGCSKLDFFDVSQCKNLQPWLDAGGVRAVGRAITFETVADGRWRPGKY